MDGECIEPGNKAFGQTEFPVANLRGDGIRIPKVEDHLDNPLGNYVFMEKSIESFNMPNRMYGILMMRCFWFIKVGVQNAVMEMLFKDMQNLRDGYHP